MKLKTAPFILVLFIIFACFCIFPNHSDAATGYYQCYQETATSATASDYNSAGGSCTASASGSYSNSSNWELSPWVYDGSWTTSGYNDAGSDVDAYMYVTYVKPAGAQNPGSLWKVKDGGVNSAGTTHSIPAGCWDNSIDNTKLYFRIDSYTIYAGGVCLNEDSAISVPGGSKKIKDIQKGDLVYSYNETTRATELKPVTSVGSRSITELGSKYYYIYTSSNNLIKATYNHEFYVHGKYVKAEDLNIGDVLLNKDLNQEAIIKIEIVSNNTDRVWDLGVEDNHNFFADNVLVHNLNDLDVEWACETSSNNWTTVITTAAGSVTYVYEEAMIWAITDTTAPTVSAGAD